MIPSIGRILVIEFNDQESAAFDEMMAVLKRYPALDSPHFDEEKVLSLPGFEIYPDRREINLAAKEYALLCLLVANKSRS